MARRKYNAAVKTTRHVNKGKKGRPRTNVETERRVLELYDEDRFTCAEIARLCGIGETTLYRIVKDRREREGGLVANGH